ncbi:MAG: type II toxin-antitoxin system VapC family toxin [Verrucomicrobia bacterium]|nr:type II toxin-antitoxin system VapC family toxin [Verrucomicrobiota bacterium]MCG2680976.1 type II toxin-antitoxin system VapC family toxin [Kiritimatiellia bacterium]MBU4248147.1 type II toxin-antitoxin system VapC family toxin [Verrucomicrobiota bacterium]MBU4290284.1 type II toxin-antitoxin system VapC family toxin [Verrucomicrobiota bacterium]MBU4428703.1 type II toxin-antitoxin system VapC family toxin [Verrucomicrobiota bacterium]
MNIVDTSGWIEYFFSGSNATFFSKPIEDTANLIVPVICLYEVFKKVNIVADEARALQIIGQMKQGRVVDLTEDIALRASLVSIRHKLPMADSLIYATASARSAILWTQDDHFQNLPGINYRDARTTASSVRAKPRR